MITNFKIYENFGVQMDAEKSEAAVKVLHILSQVQMFHWQADKMSQHNVFDDFNDTFKGLADKLVEIIQGKYGRVRLDKNTYMPIRNIQELDPLGFIEQCVDIFQVYKKNIYSEDDEIISIIDEILGEFQQLKYLLSFN